MFTHGDVLLCLELFVAYLSVVDRAIATEWFYFQLPKEKKKSLKEKQGCVVLFCVVLEKRRLREISL